MFCDKAEFRLWVEVGVESIRKDNSWSGDVLKLSFRVPLKAKTFAQAAEMLEKFDQLAKSFEGT